MKLYPEKIKTLSLIIVFSLSNQSCLPYSRQPENSQKQRAARHRDKLFDKETIRKTDATFLTLLLFRAIDDGDTAKVLELITLGVDVNQPYIIDDAAFTPLIDAILKRKFDIARCLVEHGADVNAEFSLAGTKTTPLSLAVHQKNLKIVQCLVEHGANVNAISEETYIAKTTTILHDAIFTDDMPIVQYLIEHGADINTVSNDESPLELAIGLKNLAIVNYLIKCGVQVNALNSMGITFLQQAALQDSLEMVKNIVKAGADVNMLNQHEELVLDSVSNEEIRAYLISCGAKSEFENDIWNKE
jgi:ankyrin repeat protein